MEAHTQMLSTLNKRIEDAQHLPLQILGGDNATSSNLPHIMEGIHAQIVAANLAISRVENNLQAVQTRVTHNNADWQATGNTLGNRKNNWSCYRGSYYHTNGLPQNQSQPPTGTEDSR